MSIRLLTALTAAAIGLAPFAGMAQDSGLKRLTLRQELLGWEAIGRLDIGGEGFCSAALVAPDLVLTAAHCLIDSGTGIRRDPSEIVFRAALADGVALAERTGRRAVVHPMYAHDDRDGLRQLQADIGLIELDAPIPAAEADPFAVGRAVGTGDKVSVVSYAHDRSEALAWQRACTVLGRGQAVLLMTCDTNFGSSGAPVFEMSSGRPRLVSLISRGAREGGEVRVWGMEIAPALARVKRALASGEGVWPKVGVQSRRVEVGARRTLNGGTALQQGGGAFKRVRVSDGTVASGGAFGQSN